MSITANAVVMLHGFAGGPPGFDGIISALRPDVRVLRPWLSGHGPAPALARSWDEEIERLLALLGEERAHLLGYSLGGRIAWSLLSRAPERFASAIILGGHPGLASEAERGARAEADARWIALLEREGVGAFVAAWEAQPLFATQSEAQRDAQRTLRRAHSAEGLAHALRVLGLASMPAVDPHRVAVPVTVLVGERDRSAAASALPRAERVPGAGHNLLVERPDVVRAQLTRSLA